nr:NYN domain-containing protein [Corynebacterium durum]
MLERTLVFVDTSYLLASFYNSWEIGARAQLEIDLPEVVAVLGNMIQTQLDQPVHRQLWYDGIPESGPHRYQRALRTCDGVQLRAGQLIEWGERRTQKAVDTRLVADMVLASVRGHCSDIVLVSGDADMIPGVQEATNAGIRVHLYGFGWDSMSSALRHACDTTTILDPREDFSDSMQLEVLEGPLPPSVRNKQDNDDMCDNDNSTPLDMEETYIQESATITAVEVSVPTPPSDTKDSDSVSSQQSEQALPTNKAADNTAGNSPTTAHHIQGAQENTNKPADTSGKLPNGKSIPTPGEVAKAPAEQPAQSASNSARPAPNPSMMAPRRKLRSRYVPLPNEVWASAGFQTPFDVGQQYASWWYENAATNEQRDQAHLLSGGGLPPEVDRPLLQFACETLHEYTLTDAQRVSLRDGFHSGIRGVLINLNKRGN